MNTTNSTDTRDVDTRDIDTGNADTGNADSVTTEHSPAPVRAFPFTGGASHLERLHPHIVERLRMQWGYPEGGRYLTRLIIDTRGGRSGFSKEVMSELLVLATVAADMHLPVEKSSPFKLAAQRGQAAFEKMRKWGDSTLQPLSFQL